MTRRLPAVAISLVLGIALILVAGDSAGHVEIRTEQVGWSGYIEGSVRFAQIDDQLTSFTLEDSALQASNDPGSLIPSPTGFRSLDLKPGHHRLTVWERACDGWCFDLDDPVNFESVEFEVAAGQVVPIVVRWEGGATITVGAATRE